MIRSLFFILVLLAGSPCGQILAAARNGLVAEYFSDSNLGQLKTKRIDQQINFDWGRGSPDSSIAPDNFSIRWKGEILAPATATYNFRIDSDDGSRLRVAETIIVNRWNRGVTNKTGRIDLQGGRKYPIVLEYQEGSGEAKAKLFWSTSSAREEIVPSKYLFAEINEGLNRPSAEEIAVVVDAKKKTGPFKHFWEEGVGSCNARLYLRRDVLDQLKDSHDNLGFQYTRFHNILCDDLGIYKKSPGHPAVYNWTKADRVYDAIRAMGMRPFVEFSFMPKDLASGTKTVFYYGANVTPPKDYKEWGELIANCVKHWKERYGLDEIKKWRFEIWNEPNLGAFWAGTKEDYFKLYDYGAMAVKSVDKDLKVGGPSTAGMGEWVDDFIEHCRTKNYATGGNSAPVDFVSTHGYPWDKGKFYDRDKNMDCPNGKYFYYGIREVNNKVKYSDIPSLKELHITEWGVFEYDMVHAAPYICHVLKDVSGYADSFSFWTFTDLFEEMGPVPTREFPGIFGLITVHGLRKASYNAFKMLRMMGDERVDVVLTRPEFREIESWASRSSKDSSIQVLIWNWKHPEEKNFDRNVKVKILNIPFAKATLKHYRIDSYNSNVHGFWESIGKPEQPNEMQMQQLRGKSNLVLTGTKILEIKEGRYEADLKFPVSSVSLIVLQKI